MAIKTPEQIQALVMAKAGKGVASAAYFFSNRVKEEISVPAPRERIKAGTIYGVQFKVNKGTPYERLIKFKARAKVTFYRATTNAIWGAPPRKLSGRLRASIAVQMIKTSTEVTARIGSNVIYAKRLEFEGHAYLVPELRAQEANVRTIIAGAA